jgi:GDP-L-fucose synthase
MSEHAKIYVAGHRGLVGSAVMRELEAAGYTNIITRTHKELDLTRQEQVEAFFDAERPEAVVLAAARVGGILANDTYKAQFIYENTMIAANIIHAAYKTGVRKLVNLGSSCIYPKHAPQPMKEEHLLTGPLEPTNEPYAIAKISAIKLCRYYNEQYGTNFLSAMPTNLYGPGDNFDLETSHVLPALLRKAHEATEAGAESFPVWGDGSPKREFLFVDDLARAIRFLLEEVDAADLARLTPDTFVNVGTGEDLSIKELAELIADVVGFRGRIEWDTSKPTGTPRKLMDVSHMNHLGWTAETPLRDGIEKTYRWFLEHVDT